MPVDRQKVVEYIRSFDFRGLFIEEIGWDNPTSGPVPIDIKEDSFQLNPVAEKRGVHVFSCVPQDPVDFPDRQTRQKIETRLRRIVHEHLLIFPDENSKTQIWQWVFRKPTQPACYREFRFEEGQTYEALIQKLESIVINLDDEEGLRLLDVTLKLKDAFDKDRVTKRFYDRFKKQQTTFRAFIEGMPEVEDQQWYSAVMLNRLMFIYFIQKKSFLDGDVNYLRNRLTQMQIEYGQDKFYSFYRYFLRRLFHEGLNQKEPRGEELDRLLGSIPYLNGGIFGEHELEKKYADIDIKDEAFEKLFAFFDQYQWHLDDRPLRADNEINPDVLGYIFEKYVNQKELGAYYTKEDITEYISKNTIIPFLFDQAKKECRIAFEGERSVWDLLRDDPDRYIYSAVKKGVSSDNLRSTDKIKKATLAQLADNIAIGLDTEKPKLLERRKHWNTPTPEYLALTTEIWRETVARWHRYFEIRSKLENGQVRSINDFITYNLHIRQFAQDVVENAEGPELIRAFYKSIINVTVLDPTVGSGAFLFAALNILEPLYEACLDRMQTFVDELPEDASPQKFSDFKKLLAKIGDHPSREHFIYKSIIINNLYGVDILEEAVEICKLRLFLKLVAQIEEVDHIEPLPDIDFNIRAGNTLVGYTKLEGVKNGVAADLFAGKEADKILRRIISQVEDVEARFKVFRQCQIEDDPSAPEFKRELHGKLKDVEQELDRYLAGEYGIDQTDNEAYSKWLTSHKPFHWFVEFYGILKNGGFDVIIGNPPYVEYKTVKHEYAIRGYRTETCRNLFAYVWERSVSLGCSTSRAGLIIPVASVSTDRYSQLRNVWISSGDLTISNFNDRPGKLFEGIEHCRLSIVLLSQHSKPKKSILSTGYNKWYSEAREHLFSFLHFTHVEEYIRDGAIPKLGDKREGFLTPKVPNTGKTLQAFTVNTSPNRLFYTRKLSWFVQILDFIPLIQDEHNVVRKPSELKQICTHEQAQRNAFLCVLNSGVFYWHLTVWSDCRNLNKREVLGAPLDFGTTAPDVIRRLGLLARSLMNDFHQKSETLEMEYNSWGRMRIQCIYPKKSKPIIDEIDKVLAKHYGFTEEELDFIINYDIKYRMGRELMNETGDI